MGSPGTGTDGKALISVVIGVTMMIRHHWTVGPAQKPMLEHRLVEAVVDQRDPGRSLTRPAFEVTPGVVSRANVSCDCLSKQVTAEKAFLLATCWTDHMFESLLPLTFF